MRKSICAVLIKRESSSSHFARKFADLHDCCPVVSPWRVLTSNRIKTNVFCQPQYRIIFSPSYQTCAVNGAQFISVVIFSDLLVYFMLFFLEVKSVV